MELPKPSATVAAALAKSPVSRRIFEKAYLLQLLELQKHGMNALRSQKLFWGQGALLYFALVAQW